MTFTQIVKDIFQRKPKAARDNSQNGGTKVFLSKISGAFMLPISVMAVAGLFLGIGAAIDSHTSAKVFGAFIKNLGDPIFGSMPALFAVAIIIAFTDEAGVAVFAGIVAFVVFNAIQGPFITATSTNSIFDGLKEANKVANPQGADGLVYNPNGTASFMGYTFQSFKERFGSPTDNTGLATFLNIHTSDAIASRMFKVAGSNWGIASLNTSIFGGIFVGGIVAYLYNKFHMIELPGAIAFFGGKRFVAIIAIVMMIPLAFIFLLIWPWIGLGLAYFGEYSGKVSGLDSFVFGFVERSLIPFGLHHVFYAPLWWTNAGGDVVTQLDQWGNIAGHSITAIDGHATTTGAKDLLDIISKSNKGNYMGDSFGWLAINGTGINDITFKTSATAQAQTLPIFDFISKQLDLRFGRFMQGKFSFMQLGLPAAGAAMIMAAPRENRKLAFSVVFAAALTSFITGVTEPIEFTFLFLAPWLFWGFHATMAAFSFLFMNLFGAHVGMTFSGGVIDTIIYGALPFSQGTHFYWMYVIGIVYAPIYYFVFYWAIKRFNLETPGRGGNTRLFKKADYKALKGSKGSLNSQAAKIIAAAGGWSNITKYANCATRLRYDVKDMKKVNKTALKAAGAAGVATVGKSHIQIIMGPKAEQLNTNIKANIGANLNGKKASVKSRK